MKKALLMSSSRKGNLGYLEHAAEQVHAVLQHQRQQVLFIPYAAVTFGFDEYLFRVQPVFERLGYGIGSIHHEKNPLAAIEKAEAIIYAQK